MPGIQKWQIWTILALFVLLLAVGGFYYYQKQFITPPPLPPEKPKKLINAVEVLVETSPDSILFDELKIASSKNAISEGEFQVFLFYKNKENGKNYLEPREFFSQANLNPHQDLFSEVSAVNLGRFRKQGELNSFLILKINSGDRALEGAGKWEKLMPEELSFIFPEIKTATASELPVFKDAVIKNLDARIYESDGNEKVVYALFNNNLLIITSSEKGLENIISRYAVFPPN